MKNLAFLFALMLSISTAFAQNSKVQSAINYSKPQYNQLDKAKEAIDLAAQNEKTINSPKAWKVRGSVYQTIAQSQDEKFKTLSDNPLEIAMESYLKAIDLDIKGQYKKEIENQMKLLGILLINKGIDYFNAGEYTKAELSFVNSLKVDSITDPQKIDSMVIFNAGIAADRAKDYDKAISFYKRAAELKYEGAKVYQFIGNIEKERGDTAAYLASLKDGIGAYPEDNNALMVELINFYLTNDQSNLALEYLAKAIEKDQSNPTFYFAQGALYDKLKESDKAKTSYEKAVEINPEYFDAYYNLGAIYFNNGADMLKEANNLPANKQKEYELAVKNAFAELEKALPYLEKAHEIDPKEKSTMLTLKEIYFKLRNNNEEYMTKFKDIDTQIKALEGE